MDTTVVLLALLCCSLSGVQGEGDVLREISVMLAEQRVEMAHLKKETEEQRVELTRLKREQRVEVTQLKREQRVEVTQLKRETEEQRVEVAQLKKENEAQTLQLRALEEQKIQVDRLKKKLEAQTLQLRAEQKIQVDRLKKELEAQAAALASIGARTNITESQVGTLKRNSQVRQVAFSASLLASGSVTLGPFNTFTNLVYRHVFTNIGNAYNPNTGFFTAPVRGAYQFQLYVGAHGSSHGSGAALYKNGHCVFLSYEHQTNGFGKSANGASLLLEEGDVVFIKLWSGTRMFDDHNHHSTFSGHLLFTM